MTLNKSVPFRSISEKFKVEGLESPCRIDVYCTEKLEHLSRSQLKTGLKSPFSVDKTTANIYISFDRNKIDQANRAVIDFVLYNKRPPK